MLLNLVATAVLVLATVLVAFATGVRRGRHDGVDVVWGLGFVLIAALTLVLADGPLWRRVLVTALTAA